MIPPPPRSTLFPYTTLFRSFFFRGLDLPAYISSTPRSPEERNSRRSLSCTGSSRLSPDRKSTRLNSSHVEISYAVFCLKKKKYTRYTHKPPTPHQPTPHHPI